jgi:hypothetical protein
MIAERSEMIVRGTVVVDEEEFACVAHRRTARRVFFASSLETAPNISRSSSML